MTEKRRVKNAGHNGLTLPVPQIQFSHRQHYLALVSLTKSQLSIGTMSVQQLIVLCGMCEYS